MKSIIKELLIIFYVINDLYRYQKLSINDICSNIREAEIQDKL